eukprot:4011328-Amphidinium_carterae.1
MACTMVAGRSRTQGAAAPASKMSILATQMVLILERIVHELTTARPMTLVLDSTYQPQPRVGANVANCVAQNKR